MKSYSVEFKLQVVEDYRRSSNFSAISRKYSVDRKRIRSWDREYSRLLQAKHTSRKLHPGGQIASTDLDGLVFTWYEKQILAGSSIKTKDIQEYALAVAQELKLYQFKASSKWVYRWYQRTGIRNLSGNLARSRVRYPELDSRVYGWYKKQMQQKRHLLNKDIQEYARETAQELNLKDLKVFSQWVWRWQLRNGIKRPTGKSTSFRSVKYPQLDSAVYTWYLNQTKLGCTLSTEDIQQYAHEASQKLELHEFKPTTEWVWRWRQRNNILDTCACSLAFPSENSPNSVIISVPALSDDEQETLE